jgi:hypothetical protein
VNESPSFYIQCTATLPHELNEQSSLEFVRLCECDDSDDPERVFDCVTINSSLSVSVKSE